MPQPTPRRAAAGAVLLLTGVALLPAGAAPAAARGPESRDERPAAAAAGPDPRDQRLACAGPLRTLSRPGARVLGHPGDAPVLEEVALAAAAAVPQVAAAWPGWSGPLTVLVASSADEAATVAGTPVLGLVAVALAPADAGGEDRVVVVAPAFRRLTATGRRVVLTHEAVHVATRPETGPATPPWLVEGLADAVALRGLPPSTAAPGLAREVRAGRLPSALPTAAALAPGAPDLEAAYQRSWSLVAGLVTRLGPARVRALYRAAGAAPDPAVAERAVLAGARTSRAGLLDAWRADLRRTWAGPA